MAAVSNQARREKVRKAVRQSTAPIERRASGRESVSAFPEHEVVGVKKRVLSAAGRPAIFRAAKKRWAKARKQAKKVAGIVR